jgi:anti-sigma factor RsiW
MVRRLMRRSRRELPCQAFVEVVTDYLEGSLPARERARFEHHIAQCDGCDRYLAQIRETIRFTGRLTPRDIDALGAVARNTLLEAFHSYRSAGGIAPGSESN